MSIHMPLVDSEIQATQLRLKEIEGRIGCRKCCIQTSSSLVFPLTILSSGLGLLLSCCIYCVSRPCCPKLSKRIENSWRGDHTTEDKIDLVWKAFDPDFTWCTEPQHRRSDAVYFLTAPERQEMKELKEALGLPHEEIGYESDSSDSDFDVQ